MSTGDATLPGRLYEWLDHRFGVKKAVAWAQHKEVPVGDHSMVWYYLGGTTLFFFTVQIVSGVLLLMYYQAGEATSYESIRYITTKVPFGWLVRSVHCWSAHLMIVSLMVHMYSTMLLKSYRKPRELTWVLGFGLFGVSLGFGFSGYLLPWNELAFFATSVGTDSVKSVPVVGQWLLEVMRGGPDVTINTLYRFFALHVVILPLVTFGLIGGHLAFIQVQGMAPELTPPRVVKPGLKFFPDFVVRDLLLWLCCLIVLLLLVYNLPYGPGIPGIEWELGKKANPLAPAYPGIKPEWYFLWIYQLLKEFPPHLFGMEGPQAALIVVTVLMGVWAFVPFLDRRAQAGRPSPMFTDLAMAAILFIAFLTLQAWDLGGSRAAGEPDPRAVAWYCALLTLALGAAITLLRAIAYRGRWFILSGAALLHVVLNGLVHVDYLIAGAISLVVAIVGVVAFGSRLESGRAR
jgi:cytochrome b6